MRCAPHAHDKRQVLQILLDVMQDSITYSSSGNSSSGSSSTGKGKPATASALTAALSSYGTTLPLLGALVTASKVTAAEVKWSLEDLALMLQQLLVLAKLTFEVLRQLLGALGGGEAAGGEAAGALGKEQQQQEEEETVQQCAKARQQATIVCRQEQVEGLLWAGLLSVSTALGIVLKLAHVAGVGAQQKAEVALVWGDDKLGDPLLAAIQAATTAAREGAGLNRGDGTGGCQQCTGAAAAAQIGPVTNAPAAASGGRPSAAQAEGQLSSMWSSLSEGPRGEYTGQAPGVTAGTAGAANHEGPVAATSAAPAATPPAAPAAAAPLQAATASAAAPPAVAASTAAPAATAAASADPPTPPAGRCTCHCVCPGCASMGQMRPAVMDLMEMVKAGGYAAAMDGGNDGSLYASCLYQEGQLFLLEAFCLASILCRLKWAGCWDDEAKQCDIAQLNKLAGIALILAMKKLTPKQLADSTLLKEVQWQVLRMKETSRERSKAAKAGMESAAMTANMCHLFVVAQSVLWRLPVAFCCNNVRCKKVGGISELGRVVGRNTAVCQQCRAACYCSKRCQEEAWPFHQQVCKALSASSCRGVDSS